MINDPDTTTPPVPDNMTPDRPNGRMPAGVTLMMLWIILWVAITVEVIDRLEPLSQPIRAVLFAVAGIVWILPLRRLMLWMNQGNGRRG